MQAESQDKSSPLTFDDWFNSLSPEEAADYVADLEADYWIEENKAFGWER